MAVAVEHIEAVAEEEDLVVAMGVVDTIREDVAVGAVGTMSLPMDNRITMLVIAGGEGIEAAEEEEEGALVGVVAADATRAAGAVATITRMKMLLAGAVGRITTIAKGPGMAGVEIRVLGEGSHCWLRKAAFFLKIMV